jgi:SP family sugar:H+ symporter-like MFS transporter
MLLNKKTIVTSLSGFQYGYNTSIIAAAILFLKTSFSLTPIEQGWVASTVLLGAFFSSFFTGTLANLLGRKWTNFLGTLFFLFGVGLSTVAPNYPLLLTGRFIVGIAGAIAIIVPPIYLIETAIPKERGAAANFNQIGIALGSLIAYLSGYFLSNLGSWRLMFVLGLIPGIAQIVGLFFIPESPFRDEARIQEGNGSWKSLFEPSNRPRFFLGLLLCAFQSLIGAPAIFYFTPTLFESAGIEATEALLTTVFIGTTYLAGILASLLTIDSWGRRKLTLLSAGGMSFSLALIAFLFYIGSPWLSLVMIPGILLFIFCYAIGLGPVPPVVIGEITPTRLRGDAMALTGLFGLLMNTLVTLTCPVLLNTLGLGNTLAIYASLGIVGLIIFFKKLPETKGKSIVEIANLFKKRGA